MAISLFLLGIFTFVELNCENLFDCRHDSLKQDEQFLPKSNYHWTPSRYWRKLNHIGQEILACGGDSTSYGIPDLVALCEVENDSVLEALCHRSLLRKAKYEYFVTNSPDERGVDVALLYSPFSFLPLNHHPVRIPPKSGMKPTRDILYVSGIIPNGDTLHVLVVHAPSRSGGKSATQSFRLHVSRQVGLAVDSIYAVEPRAKILIAGDFNDYPTDQSLENLYRHQLWNLSREARGRHGAKGTYRFQGEWGNLDHILCSQELYKKALDCGIGDAPFLLEPDEKYGGFHPFRTYQGPKYIGGFSDHLPLIAHFRL